MRELLTSITSKEWRWLCGLAVAVMLITIAPIAYGYLKTPPGQVFSAQHFVSADDWFVYYMLINQADHGNFFLSDLYADMPHRPVLRPLWGSVGLLATTFKLPAPAAFHLARLLLIPVFFFVAYLFIALVFSDRRQRQLAAFFLAFSSGLGTFFLHRLVLNPRNYSQGHFQWPMDLWVPDFNTFLSLYTSPHFIAATILLLLIFLFLLLYLRTPVWRYPLAAGGAALLLFLVHPFQVVKVFVLLAAFCLLLAWQRQWQPLRASLRFFATVLAISFPSVAYYLWLLNVDDLTLLRSLQNLNPSTPLPLTLVALGGLLIGALYAVWELRQAKRLAQPVYLFLCAWAFGQLLLLYLPVAYPRRLALGMHIPFVLLTIHAWFSIRQRYAAVVRRYLPQIVMVALLVFLPSTLFAISADIMVFRLESEQSYLPQTTMDAFAWLRRSAPKNSLIFSDLKTGLVLPAYAQRVSYLGHAVETPHYRARQDEPLLFFAGRWTVEQEQRFLQQRHITHVFFGPRERLLGSYNPDGKPYLEQVYRNAEVTLYRVL